MKLFLLIATLSFASAAMALSPEEIEQYRAGAGMGGSSGAQHQHRKH